MKSLVSYLLLFILICSKQLVILGEEIRAPRNTFKRSKSADSSEVGYRFPSHLYRSMTCYDVHQCALFCLQDGRCKSYNYLSLEEKCELSKTDRQLTKVPNWIQIDDKLLPTHQGLVKHIGSQYLTRQSIELIGEFDLGPCSSSPCPEDHVCSPAMGGGHQCQKTVFTREGFLTNWLPWNSWAPCPVSCGGSRQIRIRACSNNDLGWTCEGRTQERRLCADSPCPHWTHWGPWSDCSSISSCGEGTRNRSRTCRYGTLPDHKSCNGDFEETVACWTPSCNTPVRLTNGSYGEAIIYDDSEWFEPKWRYLCKSPDETTNRLNKFVMCKSYGMGVLEENIVSSGVPLNQIFLEPLQCGANENSLMKCDYTGWRLQGVSCNEALAFGCSGNISKTLPLFYAGVKSGTIPNSAITASSQWSERFAPFYGRLDNVRQDSHGGAWVPKAGKAVGEWIRVDFNRELLVFGIITQGRENHDHWITSFKIEFWTTNWIKIKTAQGKDKIFPGNFDRNTYAVNYFDEPIKTRYIRLVIHSIHNQANLRLEYLVL